MRSRLHTYLSLHKIPILLVLASLVFYVLFAYDLQREDFIKLLTLYAALFFFLIKLIQFEKWNFKFLVFAGILFRLVFLMATPNLSQDFYRFIWDGQLINNGINPYLYTPNELIQNPSFNIQNATLLHSAMGELSAKHHSNYPPINQLLFSVSTFLGSGSILGSIIGMRLIIIAADLGVLYVGKKLLQYLNQPTHLVFWYFLNPLVIIELSGNLHFEGVMFFLFVAALYLMVKGKLFWAAPIYAASIMLKLVPILFLPLFLPFLGFKKSVLFYILTVLACVIYLFPFLTPEFLGNYTETVGLWFSNFEFNSGLYNLVKTIAVGYFDQKPWELVKTYGKIVPVLTILLALSLWLFYRPKKLEQLLTAMLVLLSAYYFLSTTVHPWYLIFVLGLGIFTPYRFAVLWSAMVVLSYYAYSQADFSENLWLLAVEYLVVFAYLGYELVKNHNIQHLFRKKA